MTRLVEHTNMFKAQTTLARITSRFSISSTNDGVIQPRRKILGEMMLTAATVTSANSSITSVDQQTLSAQAVVHQMRSVDIFALKGSIVCNVVFKALIWVITHLCHDMKNISTNLSLSSLSTLLHPSFHPRLFSSKFILNYLISAIIIGQFSACESLRCWGSHMTLLECFGLWIGLQLIHISSCSFLTKPEGPRNIQAGQNSQRTLLTGKVEWQTNI